MFTIYIKQLIRNVKELIDSNTVIVGDFNTPLIINGQIIQMKNQQGNKL